MGEAVMAATLGTSAACIMVVGKVAVPEFERYGYNRSIGLGAMLAGGVLGPLIPPSAVMIIYSCLTETSLGHLFIAGIVPGILLAVMLSSLAIGICWVRPRYGPPAGTYSWRERFTSLSRIWPVIVVILSILGSIYLGVATPTESAGVGCVVVLILAISIFGLRWNGIRRAIIDAAIINGMILFILIGASFFTYVVGSANVAKYLATFIHSSGMSPWIVIIFMNVVYLSLGFILDPLTITFLTIPLFFPVITSLGFDPVWFGIVFVVNTQIGLITPPMAIDLFAVRTVFNVPTGDLIRGVTPFLLIELVFLAIIIIFPQISLWLPGLMVGK
jgi:C4-dicarboxylate transporter DctM subunit